jgi:GntR family transcriptional regulator/MocR family aminotransferase
MLTYSLEERGSLPLYEYLYRRIRADILDGTLAAGERLPSKRSLAEHLNVSVITVEGAYAQLEAEGYLYTQPKRGFFVAQVNRTQSPGPAPPLPAPPPAAPVWRLDLKSNQVDTSRFPVATWARLTRQVLTETGDAMLRPVPHQGLPALRQAIADDLRDYKGMAVSPEQIVVGAGAEYLYLLLAQLLGREAVFAVEDPGYPKIRQVYAKCGTACRPVPLNDYGMDIDALRASGATVAHLSPSHHYPTGLVTTIGRRQELLNWAEDTGGFIVEDDYDSEFRFTGRPIPTLQSIDSGGRVVYMNTFSQTISPSMRVGFMVLPPRLLERYRRELDFYACTVPALEQHVLARFLAGGYYEQHLSRMRKEYRLRRSRVLEAFRSSAFAPRVSIAEHGAGLHFLLRLNTACSDDTLRLRAEAAGVRLGFLSEYAAVPDPAYAHTLVINYASLEANRLPEAMALLADIFKE